MGAAEPHPIASPFIGLMSLFPPGKVQQQKTLVLQPII